MIYDIITEIAELRAELASDLLTNRDRWEMLKRLAVLEVEAKEAEA